MGVITKEKIRKVAELLELKHGFKQWVDEDEDFIEMPFTVSVAILKLYMVSFAKDHYIRPKAQRIMDTMDDQNSLDELLERFGRVDQAFMHNEVFGNFRGQAGAMTDIILLLKDQLEDVEGEDNREKLLNWIRDVKIYKLQHFAPKTFSPTGFQWLKRICGFNAAIAGQKSMSAMRRYFGGDTLDKFSAVYIYEEIGKLTGCDMDYLRLCVERTYSPNPKEMRDLRRKSTNLLDDLVERYKD
jgi:hypothetical protein